MRIDNMNAWWQVNDIFSLPDGFILDIQRFASAEGEGRTEKATEYKKRKAREEGKVALSKEVPSAIITLFCLLAVYFLARHFFQVLEDTFTYTFENIYKFDISKDNIFNDLFLVPYLKLFLPIGLIAFISGVFSNYLQIGLKFSAKAIKPDFKRVSPNIIKFFKNQIISVTGFFNLVKSLIKVGIIFFISYFAITKELDEIKNILFIENIFYSVVYFCGLTFSIIIKILLVLIVFSIIDIIFVRWQYEESLKMRKEEVKQEYKELYGDPNIRSRLRQMYQNLLSQKKMLQDVPNADVVITNPTHYAVCLHYDKNIDEAPRVTAKGKDKFAQKIKEVAREHDIFMYENVNLARTLYNEVDVNDVIPREMYSFVINAYKLAFRHKEMQKAG